jgi:hypothetical protein
MAYDAYCVGTGASRDELLVKIYYPIREATTELCTSCASVSRPIAKRFKSIGKFTCTSTRPLRFVIYGTRSNPRNGRRVEE